MRAPPLARIVRARHILLPFLVLTLSVAGCRKKPAEKPVFRPNAGQIQVLNGSGRAGQVEVFRDFLVGQGFDVIEMGNARDWNHDRTLVLARTVPDTIAREVAEALGLPPDRVVHLQNSASLVEATVIIGKDYKELIRKWPQDRTQKR